MKEGVLYPLVSFTWEKENEYHLFLDLQLVSWNRRAITDDYMKKCFYAWAERHNIPFRDGQLVILNPYLS